MASTQVNPTRMELTKQKKKLVTAVRGHKLLKDKRDELMRQFLDLVRENMELRKKVEAGIRSANTNFVIAKAGMSEETLNTALMAPKQEVYLETGKKNVMSDTAFIIRMLEKNHGLSFLPYLAVERDIRKGRIALLHVEDVEISMYRQIFYHKNKFKTREMEEFIRLAAE